MGTQQNVESVGPGLVVVVVVVVVMRIVQSKNKIKQK
jgi:hypothetical protein